MLQLREHAKQVIQDNEVLYGPLLAVVHFRIPYPLSAKNYVRVRKHLTPHAKKPDADNLEKFLNDSLSGVLWKDDAQIAWLLRSKTVTKEKEGSTTIFVTEISDEPYNEQEIKQHLLEHIAM